MANSFLINITGGGYLWVKEPSTLIVFTLSRVFHVNPSGVLVTAENYVLQPQVTLPPPYDQPIAISESGAITAFIAGSWQPEGQITAVLFATPGALQDLGNGYFLPTFASGLPTLGIPASGGLFANVKILPPGEKSQRPIAVLDTPDSIGDFILKARAIVQDMTNNVGGYFVDVVPALTTVTTDIDNLVTAENIAKTKRTGKAAARNLIYNIVLRDLQGLQIYIQTLADDANSVDEAIAIINASGFGLKLVAVHTKAPLQAKNGKTSGTILLIAKAVADAGAYEWQMSTDNINWTPLPTTLPAKTTVNGLTPLAKIYFRFRAVIKAGVVGWSGSVSVVVN